jgi:hypothetical protein
MPLFLLAKTLAMADVGNPKGGTVSPLQMTCSKALPAIRAVAAYSERRRCRSPAFHSDNGQEPSTVMARERPREGERHL